MTEPDQVELMIGYMEETSFCTETQVKFPNQEMHSLHRKRRQYDLMTLFKVYIRVFCSPANELLAIFGNNDPDTLEGLSPEMKLLMVILRLRGPICCIADLGAYANKHARYNL